MAVHTFLSYDTHISSECVSIVSATVSYGKNNRVSIICMIPFVHLMFLETMLAFTLLFVTYSVKIDRRT